MKRLLLILSIILFLPSIALAGKGGGTTQPTAPWPMFGNNPQHTGQSSYAGPSAGTVKWDVNTGMQGNGSNSVVIGQDKIVYVAGHIYNTVTLVEDDFLAAYNPDGTLKWQSLLYNNTAHSYDSTSAISSTGTIYVTTYSSASLTRYLHAVSPSGEILWQTFLGGTPLPVSTITVGKDGTIYVPGTELTAVNPDGTIKWMYYCNYCSSIAMSPEGNAIYTVMSESYNGNLSLVALNSNGGTLWNLPLGESGYGIRYHNPIAVADNGTIYVHSIWDNIVYLSAVTPSGTEKWRFATDGLYYRSTLVPSVSKNGNIYFLIGDVGLTNTAKIYKLDSRGRLKWTYTINDNCQNNGPAIDANENIYVGSDDGTVYSFTSGGALRWSVIPPNANYFWGNSPALGSDGRLYIKSTSYLYSIGQ